MMNHGDRVSSVRYRVVFDERPESAFETFGEAVATFNAAPDAERVVRWDCEIMLRRFAGRLEREAS